MIVKVLGPIQNMKMKQTILPSSLLNTNGEFMQKHYERNKIISDGNFNLTTACVLPIVGME